ncbi:hypothetical protein GQR58_005730 [Nymphon striatum]|nr:hypothetical protein GQR58_005730 [Nymphon striatum]
MHTNYSCERCVIKGTWNGRVVFNIDDNIPASRSERSFNNFEYKDHQHEKSPLIDAELSCIKSFPLDYMHLVCLGVVKRILSFLKQGPRECKLSHQQYSILSDKLSLLKGKMPKEFARQPRSLLFLDRWKATEFRQFLLYSGPIVLKSVVTSRLYKHFLTLTVAISILLDSNDDFRNAHLEYARELLIYFVKTSKLVYGETYVSYNVHSLIHIPDDVKNFGTSLHEISVFQFENHLQKLKKSVKKAQNPIAQISKRLTESEKSKCRRTPKRNYHYVSVHKKDGYNGKQASKDWCRAAWIEGTREEEGVIPSNWIVNSNVMWPKGINSVRALEEKKNPDEKWDKFKLIKVNISSTTESDSKIGDLGEVYLYTNDTVQSRALPSQNVSFALREKVKDELDSLVSRGIIVPVNEPTEWVSQMAIVQKSNNSLCICIDPQPLNAALKREHFKLPSLISLDLYRYIMKPEAFMSLSASQLQRMDISSEAMSTICLPMKEMFIGSAKKTLRKTLKTSKIIADFENRAIAAYIQCAQDMQKTLPLSNPLLRCLSALDPLARGHSATKNALEKQGELCSHFLTEEEEQSLPLEAHKFQVDTSISAADEETKVDNWWTDIMKSKKYPALTKLARVDLSCFHGPMVESSFNTMGHILGTRSTRMNIKIFSAIQTVKYDLRARNTTATSLFKKGDIKHNKVDGLLCCHMKSAVSCYKEEQLKRQGEKNRKSEALQLKKVPLTARTKEKQVQQETAREARRMHQKSQKRKALENLMALTAKRKKSITLFKLKICGSNIVNFEMSCVYRCASMSTFKTFIDENLEHSEMNIGSC